MGAKQDIDRLRIAIRHLVEADPTWIRSEFVGEYTKRETIWEGEVEVFELTDHPTAKRCYAWMDGGLDHEMTAILESPRVKSAGDAVQAYFAHKMRAAATVGWSSL